MTVKAERESTEKNRSVSFNSRVSVVLIPERVEIKEAQCDLWWDRSDFAVFQQSAHNEIRLFSIYENVDCRAAKQLLYQPNENDAKLDDCDMEPEEELDMSSHDSDEESDSANESNVQAPIFKHVDSVSLLSENLELHAQQNGLSPTKKLSKSSPNSSQSNLMSASDDAIEYLSLCVRSLPCELLSSKESSNKPTSSNKRRKGHRIDSSSGFAVVFGLFSFTLPIIGYYLMHYST